MAKKLSRKLRCRLVMLTYLLGIAAVVFLLPARFTAPARVIFTQVIGPAEEVAFHAGGDVLAAAGTLREAFLAEERNRTLEQELRRLRNEKARLENLRVLQELRLRFCIAHKPLHVFPCLLCCPAGLGVSAC